MRLKDEITKKAEEYQRYGSNFDMRNLPPINQANSTLKALISPRHSTLKDMNSYLDNGSTLAKKRILQSNFNRNGRNQPNKS